MRAWCHHMRTCHIRHARRTATVLVTSCSSPVTVWLVVGMMVLKYSVVSFHCVISSCLVTNCFSAISQCYACVLGWELLLGHTTFPPGNGKCCVTIVLLPCYYTYKFDDYVLYPRFLVQYHVYILDCYAISCIINQEPLP